MSLNLGTLVGSLKMDTSPLDRALDRTRSTIRKFGASAGADSERAGEQIGVGIEEGASDAIKHLQETLPLNAKGAINRASAEFRALPPALRRAVDEAQRQARFDKLPVNVREAVRSAEAALDNIDAKVEVEVDTSRAHEQIERFKQQTQDDFRELGGNINGILTKAGAIGPAVMAGASALSALAAGGTAVLGAIGPAAAGGLAAYAGGLLAVKSASAVTEFALEGIADAAGGDADAMAKLSPAGQRLATTLQQLQPSIDGLRARVQRGLFPGLQTDISALASTYLPILDQAATQTGRVLGNLAGDATKTATTPLFQANVGTILRGNASTLNLLGHAGIYLASAAATLFASAQPLIRTFGEWAVGAARTIDETTTAAQESGRLATFWQTASDRGSQLWAVLSNLGAALGHVFAIGASDGQAGQMLNTLIRVTDELDQWTTSAAGIAKINGWFSQGRENLAAMWRLITAVSSGLSDLGSGAQLAPLLDQITNELVPPLLDILNTASVSGALGNLISALGSVATAIASVYQTDNGLKAFSVTLGALATAATWVAQHVPGASSAMSALFIAMGVGGALKIAGLGGAVRLLGSGLSMLTGRLLVAAGAQTTETGAVTAGTIARGIQTSTIGTWLGVKALEIAAWARSGAAAVASGAMSAAAWLTASASAEAGLAPMLVAFGAQVAGWATTAAAALAGAAATAAAWLIAIAPIALVVAAVVGIGLLIWKNWDRIKQWTGAAWDWVVGKVVGAWNAITSFVSGAVSAVVGFVRDHWQLLIGIVLGPLGLLVGLIVNHWDKIKAATSSAWNAIVGWIASVPSRIWGFFVGLAAPIVLKFEQLRAGAIAKVVGLVTWMGGVPGRILAAVGNLGALLGQKGRDVIEGLRNGITNAWSTVTSFFGNIDTKIKSAVGNLGGLLKDAGLAIVQGLINGITERFEALKGKVGEITGWIKDHKGPKSYDLVLWRPAGNWIMTGLMNGLDDQMPALRSKVGQVTASLSTGPAGSLDFALTASAVRIPASPEVASYAARQGVAGGTTNNWHIYETSSPTATAIEVSRRQSAAGIS